MSEKRDGEWGGKAHENRDSDRLRERSRGPGMQREHAEGHRLEERSLEQVRKVE